MLKLIISFQEHLKLCFSIMWEPRWKFLTKSNKGEKKSLIIHSRIPNWVVRLTMYWQAGVIRFTYMWKLWITADHLLREKKCCLTWIYQTRDCQMHVTKRPILDGYYDTSEGRYSFFFLLSCIFIVVLFLLNIGLKFRLIFSLFIYS